MRKRLAILVALVGCGHQDRPYPAPFLPTIDGWHAVESEVVEGTHSHFRLHLTWPAPRDGLVWVTSADLTAAHAGGLPPDPVHDVTTIRDADDNGEIVEGPTIGTGYRFVSAGGFIQVCQDREYGDCVWANLPIAYAIVAGGPATTVDFPVADAHLLVGEHRPMQPMPTARGDHALGVMTSNEAVTYASSDPSVVTVDADGVLAGVAPGTATLTATAGAAHGDLPITVVAGTPALPEGPILVTPRATGWPIGRPGFWTGRTPDMMAIAPDGRPAFVLAPDSADIGNVGSSNTPLNLVRWTGSGLGFERISAWWEATDFPFFDLGLDGHVVAGWLAERGSGLVVVDRAGDVEVGGWQRRRIPMRQDLSSGSELEDEPQRPIDTTAEGVLRTSLIIGTMPAPDGIWVAYGWGANLGHYTGAIPADFPSRCVHTVRLAHVTASAITAEDVERVFYRDDGCNTLLETQAEQYTRIQIGPARDGTDRPTIVTTTTEMTVTRGRMYQHGRLGWVATQRWGDPGEIEPPGGAPIVYSPGYGSATSPILLGGGLGWGVLGPDGASWGGANSYGAQRRGPYGNGVGDCFIGPAFGTMTPAASELWIDGVRGGYGQIATVTLGDPPGVPPADAFHDRTWLYQYPLPPSPRAEDPDTLGTRLSSTAATPKYRAILPLADGTRVLIGRPEDLMMGLAASRSSGPGQPFDPATAIANASVSTIEAWTAWADGSRAWIAQGANPVALQISTDHLASATSIATTIPALGAPVHALSTSPGVSWLLTSPVDTTKGAQLWRLDDTSGTLKITELAAGASPGLVSNLQDATIEGLALGTNSVWVVAWMYDQATSTRMMVTHHYALDGTLLSAHAAPFAEFPIARFVGATGSGALVMPLYTQTNRIRGFVTSTDGGATWSVSMSLEMFETYDFPQPVLLADGRLALVATFRHGDPEQVGVMTTTDGLAWSAMHWVRPQGGHVQRAWAAARDGAGDLLIHLGDAGTIAGLCADGAADAPTGFGSWNRTQLEGLLVRVTP